MTTNYIKNENINEIYAEIIISLNNIKSFLILNYFFR